MPRTTVLSLSLLAAALAFSPAVRAETATSEAHPATPKKPATKKPVSKSRQELQSQAAGLALATDVTETINENQMQIASRVLTGTAQCEFDQTVSVDAMQDKPGFFRVAFNKASYVMTPQETTTGAVRLEDRHNGIVWLQIPAKSMMMNQKIGQRMVDGCTHAEQRAATAAVEAAATGGAGGATAGPTAATAK
jgi:hypothetical protein